MMVNVNLLAIVGTGRIPNVAQSEQNDNLDNTTSLKQEAVAPPLESDKPGDHSNSSPSEPVQEFCMNCKSPLPKYVWRFSTTYKCYCSRLQDSVEEKIPSLTERMRIICGKCQHYLRRYGYHRPLEDIKRKNSDIDEDGGDFEDEGLNGFDEEDEEEQEGEEDEDEEVFTSINSPSTCKEVDENSTKISNQSSQNVPVDNKNTLAINKYDFDEEDENVEEVSSLLKRNQAKHNILRDVVSVLCIVL